VFLLSTTTRIIINKKMFFPLSPSTFLLLLLSALVVVVVNADECSSGKRLHLKFLNQSTSTGNPVTCQDGTTPGYFVDTPDPIKYDKPWKVIVWLGDGPMLNAEDAADFCVSLLNPTNKTSNNTPQTNSPPFFFFFSNSTPTGSPL
jgi:hypothetical protein